MVDQTWEEFRRTFVRIELDGGVLLEVRPADADQRGGYLSGVAGPLHIVTACNPQGQQAPDEANAAANRRLRAELLAHGGLRLWPTTGHGVDAQTGSESGWAEPGFTVAGLGRSEALALAQRYDQAAIFEWCDQPCGFRLVACDERIDEPRGWTSRLV